MHFFKSKPSRAWPSVPSSLNHNSFEMHEKDRPQRAARTSEDLDNHGAVSAFLGVRSRLSQIWINRWTVLLLLVLVRVLILIASLNDDIGTAKVKALHACTKVEDIGSAMASMPHYLSIGVNRLAGEGIEMAVHALVKVIDLILTGVQALILFIVNMFVGTYICLTSALIHGGLDIGIGASHAATDVMNKAIVGITDTLVNNLKGVQDTINSVLGSVNTGASVFGGKIDIPKIDVAKQVDDLRNIRVDDQDFVKTLAAVNNKIPTYDDVEKAAKDALAIPFDMVKTALHNAYGAYSFDTSIFPVANKEALTFCSGNTKINDFFDGLWRLTATAKTAFIAVLVALAVAVCVPMWWLERKKYGRQKRHAYRADVSGTAPMDSAYIITRPTTARFGIWLANRLGFRGERAMLVRWSVAYATSTPALFVLSLAIAGFFSCLCQWILLKAVEREAPALANQVGDFAGEVVTKLENVSVKWAADANGVITGFQGDINDDVLGFVTNATTAVNNTLNVFTSTINDGIGVVFGGTVLDKTVKDIVRCLIGIKLEAVEKGLTWVHDAAHVTLPLFPNDTFSIGAAKSIQGDSDLTSFLASPSSVTTDEITDAIQHVINFLHNNIVQEALISTGLLLVYVIVVLLGVVRAALRLPGASPNRGDAGREFLSAPGSPLTGDGRAPPSPRRTKSEAAIAHDVGARRGGGGGGDDPFGDDKAAPLSPHTDNGLGLGLKQKPGAVRTGKLAPAHSRVSSHGRFEYADRI
jgi:hypothetical protein